MHYKFELTTEKATIENEERIVYGIKYNDEYYIHDVSVNKEQVKQMVDMFNRLELSPCHLYDVVTDMISM